MEAQVDNFIRNDIISGGEDKPRVTIITGPNACGKSIYLKQVRFCYQPSDTTVILENCSRTLKISWVLLVQCKARKVTELKSLHKLLSFDCDIYNAWFLKLDDKDGSSLG